METTTEERPRAKIEISEDEYEYHTEAYDGVCLGCGAWTSGGVEPDARKYKCDACQAMRVYGCEEALLMGRIEIIGAEE
jgi:hypothetical protein